LSFVSIANRKCLLRTGTAVQSKKAARSANSELTGRISADSSRDFRPLLKWRSRRDAMPHTSHADGDNP
jgi:hypothetical protein